MSVPWTAREILPWNQPWIFIGWAVTKAEAPIFCPPGVKSQLIGKDLMLGKIECKRRRVCQRMRWLDSITDSIDMNFRKFWEIVEKRGAWHAAVLGVAKRQTPLSDWTTICNRGSLYSIRTLLMLPLILVSRPKHIVELQFSISLQLGWTMWLVLVNRQ